MNYYGSENVIEKDISYYPEAVLLDKCELIAQAIKNQNINDLKNILSQDGVMNFLGIRQSLLKAAAFDDVCAAIIANTGGTDIEKTIEGIRNIYEEQASIAIIKSANGIDFVKALRGAEGDILADVLQGSYEYDAAYTIYIGLSDVTADTVARNVVSKEYKTGAQFNKSLEFEVLNESIKNAKNYLEVRKIMTAFKNVFSSSWDSQYQSLTSTQKANAETAFIEKVKSGKQTTTDEIGTLFMQVIKDEKDKKTSQVTSQGGGSGGNRGGSVPSVMLPTAQNKEILKEQDILSKPPFIDIDSVPWAIESISYLADKKVLTGRNKLMFEPESTVLREEFVKMAVVGFGIDTDTPECDFDDVMNQDWFRTYVAVAVTEGVVTGINESFFGSGTNIKRCDIAVILYRIAQKQGISLDGEAKVFADENKIPDYAQEAVFALSSVGVINGNEKGEFLPHANATRAEAAKMIYELLMLNGNMEG